MSHLSTHSVGRQGVWLLALLVALLFCTPLGVEGVSFWPATRSAGRPGAQGGLPNLALDDFFDDGFIPQSWVQLVQPFVQQGQLAEGGGRRTQLGGMLVDVAELKDRFELHAALPGVKKEQVKLDVDGDLVKVSVDIVKEEECPSTEAKAAKGEQPPVTWHRKERFHEFASRTMRMPDTADLESITAKMENGVLTVQIPKKERHLAAQRRVAIA